MDFLDDGPSSANSFVHRLTLMIGRGDQCAPGGNAVLVGVAAMLIGLHLVGASRAAEPSAQPGDKNAPSATSSAADPGQAHKKFADAVKGARRYPGLLDLYHVEPHLYAVLKPGDWEKPFLAPIAVAQGVGAAGMTFNFDEQWVVAFRRVGDRVQLLRKNYRYQAPDGSPLAKAVRQGYRDSVVATLDVVADDAPDDGVLVELNDVFLGNFANFSTGTIQREKSRWFSVQAFPRNVELEAEVTFTGSPLPAGSGVNGDTGYVDERGVTFVIHYGLVELPEPGYRPRLADPRLGHFVSAVKDFDSPNPDSAFVRRINRWRLEKADPDAELSPPKKQLVWWIEDTAPREYRPYIEAGILEWNKAFERIGFQNALAVRWQNDQDRFAPEDVNYCVFRWMTSPYGYAMSNLRANPLTGEIVDGDILFDSSWIRYWQRERAYLGENPVQDAGHRWADETLGPVAAAQLAAQRDLRGSPLERRSACHFASSLGDQLQMARAVLPGGELPPAALGQIIKAVVMHEVGHSLGLKHNFRGSQFHPASELHDVAVTREQGLLGSVMDYAPLNLALAGQTQGDYAATTLGPYDYWAIEYAYKPLPPEREAAELRRIAARSAEPQLAFASDEDYASANDPRVNQYDLGNDPLEFIRSRVQLADEGLAEITDRLVQEGDQWSRLRPAVLTIWRQYNDAAYLAARCVGGRYISHDARGTADAHEPLTPVPAGEQRAALKFIADRLLSDEPIPLQPALLRRLGSDLWSHWGVDTRTYEGKIGASYPEFVAAIQEFILAELLGGERLRLIQSNAALLDRDEAAFTMDELFVTIREAVWSPVADAQRRGDQTAAINRRNLQKLHLRQLIRIVDSRRRIADEVAKGTHFSGQKSEYPEDAASLALVDLLELQQRLSKIQEPAASEKMPTIDRAHVKSCLLLIEQTLSQSAASQLGSASSDSP